MRGSHLIADADCAFYYCRRPALFPAVCLFIVLGEFTDTNGFKLIEWT